MDATSNLVVAIGPGQAGVAGTPTASTLKQTTRKTTKSA